MGLIHGVTCPQVSPLGRFDYSFATIVHILNQHVAARCAAFRNLFFIDEERIVSCVGKTGVLDDLFATYSHHGNGWVSLARDGAWPTWVDLRRTRDYVGRLFDEYLAAYEVWRGDRALKCVVIDLDNTLWPGICGDEGFSWACAGFLLGGRFEGLHQVLRVLHSRGIMLATCSKNDETHVLADWRGRTNASVLSPDHCVLHRINWTRKSENIRDIASELNIGLDAILFVDDNPVERAEVAAALPQVQVYAGAMDDLRGYLLAEPRLHVRNQSREAGSRSDAVRAQLAHKRLREEASDDRSFLKNLGIRLQVRPAIADDTDRVVELVQRTNQFNTTLERITATELDALIASHNVWLLAVADRFVDYGVVGAIVIAEGAIRMLVMSCRVIALDPAVPFLVTVLRATGLDRPGVIGDIVTGPRNSPARQIYLECSFKATDTVGRYALRDAADLPEVDRGIYGVLAMP